MNSDLKDTDIVFLIKVKLINKWLTLQKCQSFCLTGGCLLRRYICIKFKMGEKPQFPIIGSLSQRTCRAFWLSCHGFAIVRSNMCVLLKVLSYIRNKSGLSRTENEIRLSTTTCTKELRPRVLPWSVRNAWTCNVGADGEEHCIVECAIGTVQMWRHQLRHVSSRVVQASLV